MQLPGNASPCLGEGKCRGRCNVKPLSGKGGRCGGQQMSRACLSLNKVVSVARQKISPNLRRQIKPVDVAQKSRPQASTLVVQRAVNVDTSAVHERSFLCLFSYDCLQMWSCLKCCGVIKLAPRLLLATISGTMIVAASVTSHPRVAMLI